MSPAPTSTQYNTAFKTKCLIQPIGFFTYKTVIVHLKSISSNNTGKRTAVLWKSGDLACDFSLLQHQQVPQAAFCCPSKFVMIQKLSKGSYLHMPLFLFSMWGPEYNWREIILASEQHECVTWTSFGLLKWQQYQIDQTLLRQDGSTFKNCSSHM